MKEVAALGPARPAGARAPLAREGGQTVVSAWEIAARRGVGLADGITAALGGQRGKNIAVRASNGLSVRRRLLSFRRGDLTAIPPDTKKTYGRKPLVEVGGVSLWPELAVVRLFRAAGWSAYWCDGFGGGRWVADGDLNRQAAELPDVSVRELIDRIVSKLGRRGGCWDVVAWKLSSDGRLSHIAFTECKGDKDTLRESQGRWLRASVDAGVPRAAFTVVEWTYESQPPPPLPIPGQTAPTGGEQTHRGEVLRTQRPASQATVGQPSDQPADRGMSASVR